MTSKRPDLRLLPDPEFPLLGGADDWIYNAAAAPGADDWEPMADGYHQAAEIVAEHLAERPGFRGYLTSPLLFLCRHSLELRIKGIIANSADLLDTPVDLIHDHDLRALWRRARPILDEVFPKTEEAAEDAGLVDRFVQELGDIDPRSMRFRYPDGAGAPEWSIVNLRRFWDRYLRAAEVLEGAGFGILNIERGPRSHSDFPSGRPPVVSVTNAIAERTAAQSPGGWCDASRDERRDPHDGNMVWNGEQQHRSSSASIFALQNSR